MEGLMISPTNGFAGFSGGVNLIAVLTFTFVAPNQIDANLAAHIWIGAFINVCVTKQTNKKKMGLRLPLIF